MNKSIIIFIFICNYCFSQKYTGELVLTSRWFHPLSKSDTLNTFKAIKDFNPSRIEWIYSKDSINCNKLKKLKLPFSLTINPMCPDSNGYTTKHDRLKTIYGETFIAPWMKNWKSRTPYWGCVNNPNFQKLFIETTLQQIKLGPYAIMVDDPDFNIRLIKEKMAGCFCEFCEKKFLSPSFSSRKKRKLEKEIKVSLENWKDKKGSKSELQKKYEAFQEESVITFYEQWKKTILAVNPNLKLFCNNHNGEWKKYHLIFDGGIAEISENNINDKKLDELYGLADSLNKSQLFNSNSNDQKFHEKLILYNLKNNRDILIPWDLFVAGSTNRFYMDVNVFRKLLNDYKN